MEWIIKTLQDSPELAIFLTLAVGFAIGMIKVKGFGLGAQLTICNFRGTFSLKWQDYFKKVPGETFFNVRDCKQKPLFAYNRFFEII